MKKREIARTLSECFLFTVVALLASLLGYAIWSIAENLWLKRCIIAFPAILFITAVIKLAVLEVRVFKGR